jgi:flavorubredoxin
VTLAGEGIKVRWQPTAKDLEACRQLGATVAAAVVKTG